MMLLATTAIAAPQRAFVDMLRAANQGGGIPTEGLRAWWGFSPGAETNDASGGGYHLTLFNSPIITNGVFVSQDSGKSTYAITANAFGVTNYPFTLSAWSANTNVANVDGLFTGFGSSTANNRNWSLDQRTTNAVVSWRNGSLVNSSPPYHPIISGEWLHQVAVFESTYVLHYVAGSLISSNANSAAFASDRFGIGAAVDSTISSWYDGYIDNVRVYNRALSQSEISALILEGHDTP